MASDVLKQNLDEHQSALAATFSEPNLKLLEEIAQEVTRAFKNGHKVLLCGNGGSAADAQHIAAEFVGRFKRERRSLPAIALTTDTSILTAIGNDYSYEVIFKRQIEGLGLAGDILIGISTSGNSKNVVLALEEAKKMKLKTVAFTGKGGGILKRCADYCFEVESVKTPRVQEMHITALHAISELVEDTLFPT